MNEADARTRLESVRALARLGSQENAAAIAGLLDDPDAIVRHTVFRALVEMKADEECFAVLSRPGSSAMACSTALQVLRVRHDPKVVGGIISLAEKEADGAKRLDLWTALCRLHERETEWTGSGWGLAPDTTGPYFKSETWEESPRILSFLRAAVTKAKGDEAARLIGELNRHQIHLDEAVDSILALATENPRHVPAAVDMLARGTSVPPEGIPILIRAAKDEKASDDVRSDAVVALSRTDSVEGCLATLPVMAYFESKPRGERLRSRPFKRAKEAFFSSTSLPLHLKALITAAEKFDPLISPWATVAILKSSAASPDARAYLDNSWKIAKGRVQLIEAIALGMDRGSKEKILASLADPDPRVAAAARAAAKVLKLDPTAKPSALVGTLKPEAVVKTMAKMKGDPDLGEQLFTQQSCVTCHTTQPGDALRSGPYLGGTAGVYQRHELAEMILFPSKSLAQGYEPHVIGTKDGESYAGFIESSDKDKIIIRDMAMQRSEIPAAAVASNDAIETSLMPPGLVDNLTEKEFAALLSYLEALSKH